MQNPFKVVFHTLLYAYYPNCIGCTQANAQAQSLNQAQEYTNFDFAFPHSDLVFRASFEP